MRQWSIQSCRDVILKDVDGSHSSEDAIITLKGISLIDCGPESSIRRALNYKVYSSPDFLFLGI